MYYRYFWSFRDLPFPAEIIKHGIEGDLWAFTYKEDERALNLKCKPVKGKFVNDEFHEYKSNGEDLKKNGVGFTNRCFADTYEEAVQGYNALINFRINKLENEIAKLNEMLI